MNENVDKSSFGYEATWAKTDNYVSKILVFENVGSGLPMHFHKTTEKSWFVNSGKFKVQWIDTATAGLHEQELNEGDVWHNPPLQPHRLICMKADSSITEVSTPDSVEDNYRVAPGDTQRTAPTDG